MDTRPRDGAVLEMTAGGGTFGGGIFKFGGGTELIVDGTVCTGGGADIIMDVITFGGGTLATLGTVTTMACEPVIGIMVGGICDIGGKIFGGGMLGGGIFGCCKLALHDGGGGMLLCCGFCIMCCCPFDDEDKLDIGIDWDTCMFGGGTFVLGGMLWIG